MPITVRYICNGLSRAGNVPTLCRDGIEGLGLACNEDYDVIVLDRMLPGGIDGFAILSSLRGLGKNSWRNVLRLPRGGSRGRSAGAGETGRYHHARAQRCHGPHGRGVSSGGGAARTIGGGS